MSRVAHKFCAAPKLFSDRNRISFSTLCTYTPRLGRTALSERRYLAIAATLESDSTGGNPPLHNCYGLIDAKPRSPFCASSIYPKTALRFYGN